MGTPCCCSGCSLKLVAAGGRGCTQGLRTQRLSSASRLLWFEAQFSHSPVCDLGQNSYLLYNSSCFLFPLLWSWVVPLS